MDTGRLSAAWPAGFAARFDPVRLIGPDGAEVAREGDRLELATTYKPDVVFDRCDVGDTVFVGQIDTVNGVEADLPPLGSFAPAGRPPGR